MTQSNGATNCWTEDERALTFTLVADGIAFRAISERVGHTRNAVIGMVDRDRRKRGVAPAKEVVTTLEERLAQYSTEGCRWIDGNPRRGGKACCAKTLPGKAFCATHYARVYIKLKPGEKDE